MPHRVRIRGPTSNKNLARKDQSSGGVRFHQDSIQAKHGAYRTILVLDPHLIVEALHKRGLVREEDWLAVQSLLIAIGQVRR